MAESDPGQQPLLPHHQALIKASAISAEVAADRGYHSVTVKRHLQNLGFAESQRLVPGLVIPIYDVNGEVCLYQLRPDIPRIRNGKPLKYETPALSQMRIDVPPSCHAHLGNPDIPLFITEGVRKADAATSCGICCIDVLGVWNWRGSNDRGGTTALADWEMIALKGRQVYITFDSDVMTKPEVHNAMARFKAFLESRGATVFLIYLPPGPSAGKCGLDDWLAAGGTVAELMALASPDLRSLPTDQSSELPYQETPGGLVRHKPSGDGVTPVQLTNFTARITADVLLNDGVETERCLEIEARIADRSVRFTVAHSAFTAMRWPLEHLGSDAIVYPGFGAQEHARTAIQMLSTEKEQRTVFAHVGWIHVEGAWLYLHSGGAIGAEGLRTDLSVHLPESLSGYLLPIPPDGDALSDCIRASLGVIDIGPDGVTFPLIAATYLAPLGNVDLSLWLAGPTGVFKSALAAISQQHYGSRMDARHLPASWSSTGNALEGLAFAAKDAVMVVDDFAPAGSQADINRLHREADRLLRAQGNTSGRQRMRADASIRDAKPPRGLILSTGEDIARGQSLRARMMILELSPGQTNLQRLSRMQKYAEEGVLAKSFSGYLQFLAADLDGIRQQYSEKVTTLRDSLVSSMSHMRTPDIVAKLHVGFGFFLDFAVRAGAIDHRTAEKLGRRCLTALISAAQLQGAHQRASDPVHLFISLIRSALVSGRAHVASPDGGIPENAQAWGWRAEGFTDSRPLGQRIGWTKGEDLYLDGAATYAAANQMARDLGDNLPVGENTLRKRLEEKGILLSRERARDTPAVRRKLEGAVRKVLHMNAGVIHTETDITDISDISDPDSLASSVPEGPRMSYSPESTDMSEQSKLTLGALPNELEPDPNVGHVTNVRFLSTIPTLSPGTPCPHCGSRLLWRDYPGRYHCRQCEPPASEEVVDKCVEVPDSVVAAVATST